MASNKTPSRGVLDDLGFTQISPGVRIYEPSSSAANDHTQTESNTAQEAEDASALDEVSTATQWSPTFVIFCSWFVANPRHIVKYLKVHQKLHPHATILLLESDVPNVIYRPDAQQMRLLKPAIEAFAAFNKAHSSPNNRQSHQSKPVVLVHSFSNGGAHSLAQFAQAWAEHNREGQDAWSVEHSEFPVTAMVIDSAPSGPDFLRSVQAARTGLPKNPVMRALGTTAITGLVVYAFVTDMLGITEPAIGKAKRMLNEDVLLPKGIPRTYIYSGEDQLVPAHNVITHALEARQRMIERDGLSKTEAEDLITLEDFGKSPHVGHMMTDQARYWQAVEDTLKRGIQR